MSCALLRFTCDMCRDNSDECAFVIVFGEELRLYSNEFGPLGKTMLTQACANAPGSVSERQFRSNSRATSTIKKSLESRFYSSTIAQDARHFL
eukprot:5314536-Amphidinium_carterae.1